MTPLHLGALHPLEQVLTLLLAFGPFAVLGAVVWWRRRTDDGIDPGPDADPDEVGLLEEQAGAEGRAEGQRER